MPPASAMRCSIWQAGARLVLCDFCASRSAVAGHGVNSNLFVFSFEIFKVSLMKSGIEYAIIYPFGHPAVGVSGCSKEGVNSNGGITIRGMNI